MNITTTWRADRKTANAADLAAQYKALGYDKYKAWDMFVIDRSLKPEMNAKDFYALFASVSAANMDRRVSVDFQPTHLDAFGPLECQITETATGFDILWADGHTGHNPLIYPPEPERFTKIS
jgi:hypothetical protein